MTPKSPEGGRPLPDFALLSYEMPDKQSKSGSGRPPSGDLGVDHLSNTGFYFVISLLILQSNTFVA